MTALERVDEQIKCITWALLAAQKDRRWRWFGSVENEWVKRYDCTLAILEELRENIVKDKVDGNTHDHD